MHDEDRVLAALVQKLDWAAQNGCPVTGLNHMRTARWVVRRWRSAKRRVEDPKAREHRVSDLVEGFLQASGHPEPDESLRPDFVWLVDHLADALD